MDYLITLKNELEKLQRYPFSFKGILSQYNTEGLTEHELFKIFYKEGVYIKRDPLYKYEIDNKNILKYGKHYGFSVINPILYYEFLSYLRINILVEVICELSNYKHFINSRFEYELNSNKRSYIEKEINTIFKEIDKNIEHKNLFSLFKSSEFRNELIFSNWLSVVDNIIFPEANPENKLEESIFLYIKNPYKSDLDHNLLKGYNKWLKVELFFHKLELLKIISENLNKANATSIENNHSYLNETDQKFLKGISEILIDKNNLPIFEEIIQLKEDKNKPFFAAIYTYFSNKKGEGKKLFYITKSQPFYNIIKESYGLDIKFIPETGTRPDDLKDIFEGIYLKHMKNKNN